MIRHAHPEQARLQGWRVTGEIRRGVFYGADARFRELVDAAREAAA